MQAAASILADYQPSLAQRQVHESRARFKVIVGAARSGKSRCGSSDFIMQLLRDHDAGKDDPRYVAGPFSKRMRPRALYWLVSFDFSALREAITYLQASIPKELIQCWLENEATLWLKLPRGFTQIECKSADAPEKLVSRGVHGVFVDEAARCDPSTLSLLRTRLIDFAGWLIAASTPYLGRGNPLYRDYISRASENPDIEVFTLSAASNPSYPLGDLRRLKEELPARFYERDVLGLWTNQGSDCFPEWDHAVHRISEKRLMMELGYPHAKLTDIKNQFREVLIAIDFGYSAPAAMLVIVTLHSGEYIVADEFYQAGVLVSDPDPDRETLVKVARQLRDKWVDDPRKFVIVADTEDAQARAQFTSNGLWAQPANKDHTEGVRQLSKLLHVNGRTKRPRLRVLDTCKQTITNLPRVSWRLDKFGDPIEGEFAPGTPLHAPDALRYGAAFITRFETDVPTIEPRRAVGGFRY